MVNIMIIGLGPHSKRIYYPICVKDGKKYGFRLVHCVDLIEKKNDIENYLGELSIKKVEMTYVAENERTYDHLHPALEAKLNKIVKEKNITGVIISTEPLAHLQYAAWALKEGLHILMDKPLSTAENITSSLAAVEKIKDDYDFLAECYKKARIKNDKLTFSLMAQRRWHPAFIEIKRLIGEVFERTNFPISSTTSFHGDGQWRMPTEIIEQNYHPYNQGYGKCCHSGYHSIDIVPWLIRGAENDEKYSDNVDIFSNFSTPIDFINQFNTKDYQKLFSDYDNYNKYSDEEFIKKAENFGEIDAFNLLSFKQGTRQMTLSSINLAHNGCSQRNWVTAEGRDLYKGNGRVRHESHYLEQGPFQSISFTSYQSKEIDLTDKKEDMYNTGGEYHLDIHVFRNNKLFPDWKAYEKITIKDLDVRILEGKSRGHQEDARRESVLEFISLIKGKKMQRTSDFFDHRDSTMLLYGIYKSSIKRRKGENPLVNINLKK